MADPAALYPDLGGWHLPGLRRSSYQHGAGSGAGLAQVVLRVANGTTAHCGHVAPGAVHTQVFLDINIGDLHLLPVGIQFLGNQLGRRGQTALPHFTACITDRHGIIGGDLHPDVDTLWLSPGVLRLGLRGDGEPERKTATDGGATQQEMTTFGSNECIHDASYACATSGVLPATSWMASRMRL